MERNSSPDRSWQETLECSSFAAPERLHTTAPARGDVLAGRYVLQDEIGRGASSRVFRAYDLATKTLIAVKLVIGPAASRPGWMDRLGGELRLARRHRHPHVADVYDLMEADGHRFLTMALASGGTLRQRLATTDRLLAPRIADARAVISGLAAIHAEGIIHRDVKPENVLRMEDGRLVVTDFGLAIAPDQTTFVSGYSGAVGTPSYMAPEVALGGDASMASDVFSLGVILHEIFFDRRPDWHITKRERYVKHPLPGKGGPRVLRAMAKLCLECLAELPVQRPQDAGEVGKRFEKAVLGRYGAMVSALRSGRWGIATGLILALIAAVGSFFYARPSENIRHARLSDKPQDWSSMGRLVARRAQAVVCAYPTEKPGRIRVIWGAPGEAVEMDFDGTTTRPWAVAPETYENGWCPEWSPDGSAVVFSTRARPGQVKLSFQPDGSKADTLTVGFMPRWLPNGREVIHQFDRRRLAVTDLARTTTLLPDVARAEETLVSLSVARSGDIAALFSNFNERRSAVVLLSYPTWSILRRVELPNLGTQIRHVNGRYPVSLVLIERSQDSMVTLDNDDDALMPLGTLGVPGIASYFPVPNGHVVALNRSFSSFIVGAGSEVRSLGAARAFDRISFSNSGDAVSAKLRLDGRRVVAFYDQQRGRLFEATGGPDDRDPIMFPNERAFAFIDLSKQREVRKCVIDGTPTCRTILQDPGANWLLGVSPSGLQMAYFSRDGVQLRLKVASLQVQAKVIDLGSITSNCRVKWPTEDKLWIFQRIEEAGDWVELDVSKGGPTGRRERTSPAPGGEICPPVQRAEAAFPRVENRVEGEIWIVPGSGKSGA